MKDLENVVIFDSQDDPDTPVREFISFRAMIAIKELSNELELIKSGDYVCINGYMVKRPITFTEWQEEADKPDFDWKNQKSLWYVDFTMAENVKADDEPVIRIFDEGLVHRTKEDALRHADALLSFTNGGRNG